MNVRYSKSQPTYSLEIFEVRLVTSFYMDEIRVLKDSQIRYRRHRRTLVEEVARTNPGGNHFEEGATKRG